MPKPPVTIDPDDVEDESAPLASYTSDEVEFAPSPSNGALPSYSSADVEFAPAATPVPTASMADRQAADAEFNRIVRGPIDRNAPILNPQPLPAPSLGPPARPSVDEQEVNRLLPNPSQFAPQRQGIGYGVARQGPGLQAVDSFAAPIPARAPQTLGDQLVNQRLATTTDVVPGAPVSLLQQPASARDVANATQFQPADVLDADAANQADAARRQQAGVDASGNRLPFSQNANLNPVVDAQQMRARAEQYGRDFGQSMKDGAITFGEGVMQLNQAVPIANDFSKVGFSGRDAKDAFAKVASGAMTLTTPVLAAEIGANPAIAPSLAIGILSGEIGGEAAAKISKALGADQTDQNFYQTLAGIAAGAVGGGLAHGYLNWAENYRGSGPDILKPGETRGARRVAPDNEPVTAPGAAASGGIAGELPASATTDRQRMDAIIAERQARDAAAHPAGKVTGIDQHTGLPIVDRTQPSEIAQGETNAPANETASATGETKPAQPETNPQNPETPTPSEPVGTTDPESGRVVTQLSDKLGQAQALATAAAPELKDKLGSITGAITGAGSPEVRDKKNPARAEQKATQEGQPVETISDLLAARVPVDSPAAHDAVVAAIGKQFPIIKRDNNFEQGDPKYGYRADVLQVQMGNGSTAEVQIVPKEIIDIENQTHGNYKAGREAEIEGRTQDAEAAQAANRAAHDAAMAKFNARNGVGETPAQKPLYEMSLEELEAAHDEASGRDKTDLVGLFGQEGAKKYSQLQRTANGSSDRADAASEEIERMEAGLTEAQRNRLFGIGDTRHQPDDIKEFRDALRRVGTTSPEDLAESLKYATYRLGDPATPPEKMTRKQQVAYAQLRHGFEVAQANGWDTEAIIKQAIRSAGKLFADPADARFMLERIARSVGVPAETVAPSKTLPASTALAKGARVALRDGSQGTVSYVDPQMKIARVRTDDGRNVTAKQEQIEVIHGRVAADDARSSQGTGGKATTPEEDLKERLVSRVRKNHENLSRFEATATPATGRHGAVVILSHDAMSLLEKEAFDGLRLNAGHVSLEGTSWIVDGLRRTAQRLRREGNATLADKIQAAAETIDRNRSRDGGSILARPNVAPGILGEEHWHDWNKVFPEVYEAGLSRAQQEHPALYAKAIENVRHTYRHETEEGLADEALAKINGGTGAETGLSTAEQQALHDSFMQGAIDKGGRGILDHTPDIAPELKGDNYRDYYGSGTQRDLVEGEARDRTGDQERGNTSGTRKSDAGRTAGGEHGPGSGREPSEAGRGKLNRSVDLGVDDGRRGRPSEGAERDLREGFGRRDDPRDLQQRPRAGERGSGLPRESWEANLGPVGDWLSEQAELVKISREIGSGLDDLDPKYDADVLRAVKLMQALPGTPADQEQAYHALENPREPTTPVQRQIMAQLAPMRSESTAIFQKLYSGQTMGPNYVHRIAQQKGNLLDRILKGSSTSGRGNVLKNNAAASKQRSMMAIESPSTGARQVVSVSRGRVTAWNHGIPTDIGALRAGMTTPDAILEKALKPLEDEQKALETEKRTLSATPSRQAAARVRLQNIDNRLRNIDQEKQVIENHHLLQNLPGKVWKDNQKNLWKFDQATTKEIERHTPVTYYKNAAASTVTSWLELRKAERAADYLESVKADPAFPSIAVKPAHAGQIPDGWKSTQLPQLSGYYFEPHVAEVFDRYADDLAKGDPNVFQKINGFLTTSIFLNPIAHLPNLTANWLLEKGLSPADVRGWGAEFRAGLKAFNAVAHQNSDFLAALDAGAPLQSQRMVVQSFADTLVKKLQAQAQQPSVMQKLVSALGSAVNVPHMMQVVVDMLSAKVTWPVHDMFILQSAYAKMERRGISLQEALRDTAEYIPDERFPTRVLNSKALADVLNSPLFMFSHYHYGVLKAYGNIALHAAGAKFDPVGTNSAGEPINRAGRTRAQEAMRAASIAAGLGLMLTVVYPAIDKLLEKATGNKDARFRRAGLASVADNAVRVAKGDESGLQAARSVATPSAGVELGADLATNRDLLGNQRKIYDPNAPGKDIAKEVGTRVAEAVSPAQLAMRASESGESLKKVLLGIAGVTFPRHGALRMAAELRASHMGDQAQTPQERRKSALGSQARYLAWQGDLSGIAEAKKSGLFAPRQIADLYLASKQDPLMYEAKSLGFKDLLTLAEFRGTTAEERGKLLRMIIQKAGQIQDAPKEERDALRERLHKLIAKVRH